MKEVLQVIDDREILGKNVKIYGTIDEPLFLAKDVANWIERSPPKVALQQSTLLGSWVSKT